MSLQVNRWYVPHGNPNAARLVTGQEWNPSGRGVRVTFVTLWPVGKGRFSVAETRLPFWEWRMLNSRAEVMPEGWTPEWFGKWPEGPSMRTARLAGRIP